MRENIITVQSNSPRTTKLYFRHPVCRQILTKENLTGSGLMAKLQSTIFFSEIKFPNLFTGGHKLISIANTPLKA